MINDLSKKWNNVDSLEMLFYFYQLSEELLGESTPDSFALPMHNKVTLVEEMRFVFQLLNNYRCLDEYYKKYICPIIDEFLSDLSRDYLVKNILGKKFDSFVNGFKSSKESPKWFGNWVESFLNICSLDIYEKECRKEVVRLVRDTNDKKKLNEILINYYVCLVSFGYSKQGIKSIIKSFFRQNDIDSLNQIENVLSLLSRKEKNFEFLILLKTNATGNAGNLWENFSKDKVSNICVEDFRNTDVAKMDEVKKLIKKYDQQVAKNAKDSYSIISYKIDALDYFSAAQSFDADYKFFQIFPQYYSHIPYTKTVDYILLKRDDGLYTSVYIPYLLKSRKGGDPTKAGDNISNIVKNKLMGPAALDSFIQAMEMHSEAIESRNVKTILRNFWIALESLCSVPSEHGSREDVFNAVGSLSQKTYILKTLRILHHQVTQCLKNEYLDELNIREFDGFVMFFVENDIESELFKKLFSLCAGNILLRSRLHSVKETYGNSQGILNSIKKHAERIEWHLKRLYRMRNIATHLGLKYPGMEVAVNHLHNYFDYVVNYILCKTDNGEYIHSLPGLFFDAKNDVGVHLSLLKNKEILTKDNYIDLLFGSDKEMQKYSLE
ncbi:hypothetical protein [Fibrobacter sp. UWB7]|uniref:hypothetical protein n=1 Tax=Fibrobacter sp. UWB7 TaxID=1896206 RepID=UPI00091900C0|nr:hypothetical protein [Fibrobacter sp. UWB7]SHM93634.1 hypothetical protein SAMN05720467_2792 [Fibrobacter sp. UWB7]